MSDVSRIVVDFLSTDKAREHSSPDDRGCGLKIGQPFKPHGCFNGAFTPFSVLRLPDLSLGSKVLYGRLCAFAGRDGACYPSRETLGAELGVSVATIKRHLAELTKAKLIRRELPETIGRGQTARVVFLWHEALAASLRKGVHPEPLSVTEGGQLEPLSRGEGGQNRAERGSESTHERGSKSTHAHKEEKESSKKISEENTSSSLTTGGVTDQGGASTATNPPIEAEPPHPEPGRWYTPEQFEKARTWLDAHRTGSPESRTVIVRDGDGTPLGYVQSRTVGGAGGSPPDAEITRRILAQFSGFVEFQRWMFSLALPRGGVSTYGFYLHDARRNWPTRRPAAELASAPRDAWSEASDWSERSLFWTDTPAAPREAAVPVAPAAQPSPPTVEPTISSPHPGAPAACGSCQNDGVRFVSGVFGLVEFCACWHGERKRRSDPSLVDRQNQSYQRLQRLQALAEAAA